MVRKTIIGVMGPGDRVTKRHTDTALELGELIGREGWVLLTGGRNCGIMEAASQGCRTAGGLVLGILPDEHNRHASRNVDIAVVTGLGSARNNVNVLTADVIIACGLGAGTASEVALAIKAGKYVGLIGQDDDATRFFRKLGVEQVSELKSPQEAVAWIRKVLNTPR